MTDEAPDVRELTLTKLGPDGAEAKLTLGDDKLTVVTAESSPLPDWMRGEIAFDELDIAYIGPARERKRVEWRKQRRAAPAPAPRLPDLPSCLKPSARVAILTFHSGEDRRVKKAFQAGQREGIYARIAEEPIRPGPEERCSNPRSASAKLRWAVKR